MTPLAAAMLASQGAAAVAGVVLATRRREHVPAAVALSVLAIEAGVRQFTSVAPSLVHVDRGLLLLTSAALAGLSVSVLLPPRFRRPALACVVGAWALACVALPFLLPPPAPVGLQRFYLAADLVGLAVSVGALLSWFGWARGKEYLGSSGATALALIVLDFGILLAPHSPWRGSIFGARFDGVQFVIVVMFSVITVVEVILWRFPTKTS